MTAPAGTVIAGLASDAKSNGINPGNLILDDGSREASYTIAAIDENGFRIDFPFTSINRFTPEASAYPALLRDVYVFAAFGGGILSSGQSYVLNYQGQPVTISAWLDADGDGDPRTNAVLLSEFGATFQSQGFNHFALPTPALIDAPGQDILLAVSFGIREDGVVTYPMSIDLNSDPSNSFYYSGEGDIGLSAWVNMIRGFLQEPTPVEVDVKPGSAENPVNLASFAKLPVALLTTNSFDATTVNPATLTLGDGDGNDTPLATRGQGVLMANAEDVDLDGDLDLILHFNTKDLGANDDLTETSTVLVLKGLTHDGTPIRGTDAVNVVPEV